MRVRVCECTGDSRPRLPLHDARRRVIIKRGERHQARHGHVVEVVERDLILHPICRARNRIGIPVEIECEKLGDNQQLATSAAFDSVHEFQVLQWRTAS